MASRETRGRKKAKLNPAGEDAALAGLPSLDGPEIVLEQEVIPEPERMHVTEPAPNVEEDIVDTSTPPAVRRRAGTAALNDNKPGASGQHADTSSDDVPVGPAGKNNKGGVRKDQDGRKGRSGATAGGPPGTRGRRADKGLPAPGYESPPRETPQRKTGRSRRSPPPAQIQGHDDGNLEEEDAPFMDAVVKVFCTHTEPNYSLPWQRKRQFSSNSSGFIIGGRRVLTNAHSVEHHTQVKVKKRGSDTKFLATVLAIGTECDIAMLTVEDDDFWEGVTPLKFGSLPRLQDSVTVVGYPIGGDTISVTSGVVSRIEVTSYTHRGSELLGVQIDAAINAGNSGGPAFNESGNCVGIAFQSLKNEDAENIGYVIPTPVINHFITDFERTGGYTGFPILGIEWQKMENPQLRKALGMTDHQKGVRVRRVEPTAPSAEQLQASDILLSFDGVDVANDGTVPFRRGERIAFSYLVSQRYTGETARLTILREGREHQVQVKLGSHNRLVPVHTGGKPPSYYIVAVRKLYTVLSCSAGLVFTPVSVPYLASEYGKNFEFDAPVKLLDKMMHIMADASDQQVVVVSQVLVADINIGYEEIVNTQVLRFNGTRVNNLKHLPAMVEAATAPFLRFDLEYDQVMVLETAAAKAATPSILKTHRIPSAKSEDLNA